MDTNRRRMVWGRAAAGMMIAGALFLFASPAPALAEDYETEITGFKATQTLDTWKGSLTDTVTVTPAYGRTLKLQWKDPETGTWTTMRTYTTADTETAKVMVKYPATWKRQGTTDWRLVAEKTAYGEDAAFSRRVVKSKVKTKYATCKSAIVYDAETGKVVYAYNPKSKRAIASMTKMMTAIRLVETTNLSTKIKITKKAANTDYAMGLKAGDTLTAKQLLYCMMLPSSNDASTATAIGVSGSVKKFVKTMNAKAVELGCTDTVYKNPHGLPASGAYSTAIDQARIASYIMTSPSTKAVRKAAKTKKYSFTTAKGNRYKLTNLNTLLGGSYDALGVKTGYTKAAGCCFTGAFDIEGKTYITVVMGANSTSAQWADTKKLVKYAKYSVNHNLDEYNLS